MNSVKIGTYQMDTAFGLYLPEYTIPAPAPQTKFVKIIGRDGSVDLSDAIGLHYDSRSWSLDFKCFDPTVNWHTLTSSVMNAIHGKRLNFSFDDDPDYFWTGRISVSSYVSSKGTGTLKVNITSDPFKYAKLSTIVTKTASTGTEYTGSMVTFNDGLIYDLSADIEPIQSLHGYDHPWPAGGGKQLLNPSMFAVGQSSGVTASANPDGTITLNGTATSAAYIDVVPYKPLSDYGFIEPNVSYTLSGHTSNSVYVIFGVYGSGADYRAETDVGVVMTFTESQISSLRYRMVIYVANGTNVDGVVVKPMICKTASADPAVFAPYSNICPISGLTGLSVYRTGKNLVDPSKKVATSTTTAKWYNDGTGFLLHGGQAYALSSNISTDATYFVYIYDMDGTQLTYGKWTATYTPSADTFVYLQYYESGGANLTDAQLQLELGSASTYEPYSGNTYAVDWTTQAGTVYHGTVDPVTGQLNVTHSIIDLGDVNWNKDSNRAGVFYGYVPGRKNSSAVLACSEYIARNLSVTTNVDMYISGYSSYGGGLIFVRDTRFASNTGAEYKAGAAGIKVVYELATPVTYQLTPKQIEALVGTNNVWSSSGDVTVTVVTPETVTNNGNPAVPTVTASADMVLRWGNYSASVQQGTSTIPQLVLETGDNKICIIGTGNISFEWSEASL